MQAEEVEDETIKEQLKESGIGTPATRAAIIERLLSVGYIRRTGKTLIPEEKGIKLCMTVPDELKSPQTTGKGEGTFFHSQRQNAAGEVYGKHRQVCNVPYR